MSEYFAIQFPFTGVSAWQEVSAILRAGCCPMPGAYRDDEHLLLVWRYERHANECAWELCHHVMHILLYEKMPDMHRFYNEFRTEPIMCSSERLCRVLRFGVPHGFMCDGELPPLPMDALEPLYECERDDTEFQRSVRALLERTLDRCLQVELETWDPSLLYLTYKRIEAMAITCNSAVTGVGEIMEKINEAIRKAY